MADVWLGDPMGANNDKHVSKNIKIIPKVSGLTNC